MTLRRAFWILLLPCVSGWAACESAGAPSAPSGGAAGAVTSPAGGSPAGGSPEGGAPSGVSGAPQAGAVSLGVAGAEAGASGAPNAACAEAASPNAWASWPLSDPSVKTGPRAQSFTLTDNVATDNVTQLVWQRHAPAGTYTWPEAEQYCACLSLEGQTDWQLPSRMELVSIVDYTRQDPALDPAVFPDTPFEWFWSASPVAFDTRYWYVAFWDGNTHANSPDQEYRVRCVRTAAGLTPRYDTSVEGTVKDAATGLTWQREASAERAPWVAAGQACAALTLAGGGWRLPSMSELQSVVDESRTDPAVDAQAFPATPSEGFWAATPLAGDPSSAWFVSFLEGIAYNATLGTGERVRCVR